MNVFVKVLKAVIANSAEEEPRAHIPILIFSQRLLTLRATIDEHSGKVTWEFTLVLGDQAPARWFILPLNLQAANLIAPKLKPQHVSGHV